MQTVQGPKNKFLFLYNLADQSLFHRSRNSGREFLGGTKSFVGQFLHPSLVQSSRSIPHMQTVQGLKKTSFFSCTILKTSLCFTDQEPQKENFFGGTNSFVGQFLHPSLVQSSRSILHMQTVQGPKNKFLFLYNLADQSLFHRSRNSGREFLGWNQLLCRSVLTPISCTKFKIHSTHADSPRA